MPQQNWNETTYKEHASFVPALANDVIGLLKPRKGERILDVGCGDGVLTLKIQEKGCSVIGVDSSMSMVETAINRGIEAYVIDAHDLNYQNEFDAIFSNAALHWLIHPVKVIKNMYSALKLNGRFVAEFGGDGNIAALLKAMQDVFEENKEFGEFTMPWFFPSADEYKCLLEKEGFKVNYIELIPRPTPLKSGIEKWLEIFAEGITSHLSAEQKNTFMIAVKDKLITSLYTEKAGWIADYVRLRFAATKT
ncbi:class I SAM-dependent methyltransferase [Nitrosomonas supralitoralis]|uniref:SAM-dependent methyltransferase n=1 Tax=Nitrosomonas supralitoralis TaxID=2116706 RepID=A0A2P7NRU0_9PROT|nr:class I SAM-dependent methyltransferase [Nitrosomonas supralitoralis]PSJ16172.1 SAM-dependent methyltransferase [Nitrosomonas supralitoralis]